MARHVDRATARRNVIVMLLLIGVAVAIAATTAIGLLKGGKEDTAGKLREVQPIATVQQAQNQYDVVVVGTDPEGVAAAVSAARNGLKTLLVDGRDRDRLGGLMTLGWLNSLDHNYDREKQGGGKPAILNQGIFIEWYEQVEGDSFDVVTATNAFHALVRNEKNIDVLLKAKSIAPKLAMGTNGNQTIVGVTITKADGTVQDVAAKAVIDATQDADIAYAAGVPFTIGRADLGDEKARMAVTLVFQLDNITPDVWKQVQKRLRDDGDPNTDANELSAWGYGEMQKYPAQNKERVKMRGLNIGRQNDNTILINALQIFGIDGVDPKSREEAFEIGKAELPHVLAHMKQLYPEFANSNLIATAPELYIRESRHMIGEYRLGMIDVLENRDQWDRVAFGSYPVDIQRISPTDNGAVMSHPLKYAVPFRSLVPLKVDNLLVVGRSASFDTLPHGSARVIPVGMATAEAAGAAAKLAMDKGVNFRQLSASKEHIAELQDRLNKQGMDIKPYTAKREAFMEQKEYAGLREVVNMGLVIGGYDNSGFDTKPASNPQRFVNLMQGVKRVHKLTGDPAASLAGMPEPAKQSLTLSQTAWTMVKTLGYNVTVEQAEKTLLERGVWQQETVNNIADKQKLTNGDTYMLIRDLLEWKRKQ